MRRFALAALAVAAALSGLFYLRPFQTVTYLRKVRLRLGGVVRVRAESLAAYEKDLCAPGAPCSCVALIHGLGDSALTWDNILLGRHGAARPQRGMRLLALELPGSEGSREPAAPEGYAVPAMAESVEAALESRCPRWTVVGNSLGGWVAAWVALQRPVLVERLILVNAAGLADPSGALVKTARTLEDPTVEKMKDFVARAYHAHPPVPERAWPAIVASIRSRPAAKIVAALKEEYLLDGQAKLITAPTTILWGKDDGVVPLDIGRGWARLLPHARLELIPDCGHLPQQECPASVSKAIQSPGSP